ncbi:MAG: SurA N-terminal domain-containing protein [Cytophagaceae bacterium]|nr:SurA N-terminal domain-containing protein [Cytophagaceae bacterium]
MSLITKIREKSGVAIGVIAISLILFIIGGDLLSTNSFFGGGNSQKVGEIAGNTILYQDFNKQVEAGRVNFQAQSGRAPSDQETVQLREQAWNQFIGDYALTKELDALGIEVTPDELADMVQGVNIHPQVRQQFTNPQTGQFDKTQIIAYLKTLKAGTPQLAQWQAFEKGLAEQRRQEKYFNLLRLTNYVTTAEAKRDYENQTAKADVRYLYVPFYSVPDSTIQVTDAQLEDYLGKHRDQYKGADTRSLQYVIFPVIPSKQDSATFKNQLTDLAKNLAKSTNDSAFALLNSDVASPYYLSASQLPEQLKEAVTTFNVGGVYGPYREGNLYSIYKYDGTKTDSLSTVRASHILIQPTDKSDSAKATARQRALNILNQVKGGSSFEAMAATNGMDGSAQQGGDLGYFKNNGQMVKGFQDAVFAFNGTGLMPNLVETDFGFHIIKVTEPKSNLIYKIAAINKEIVPSEATRDEAYRRAEAFAGENQSQEAFEATLKKDKTLAALRAERIPETSTNLNTLQDAREVIRWAFDDKTDAGEVSPVYEADERYVVAVLTNKTAKDDVKAADFKDELTAKVRNDLKGEQILKKLQGTAGTLEQIAQKSGAGALVETANGVTLATGVLTSAGADPVALGKAFGLKPGQKSKPFVGDGGVFIMETLRQIPAPVIADFTQYKTIAQQQSAQRASFYIGEAVKENAKIVDNRARFY